MNNPFLKVPITTAKDIWGDEFFDFPEFNAHASDVVLQSLRQMKDVFSIAITGNVGSGKSQVFSRIRHKLSETGEALCIYINADRIANLDSVSFYFQQFLIDSLCHKGKSETTYLQEVATDLVNQALKGIGSNRQFTPKELLEQFDTLARNKSLVEKLTKQIQQLKPYLSGSSNVIRAILWSLSASSKNILDESDFFSESNDSKHEINYLSPDAINWLKGISISEHAATEMNLPDLSIQEKDREAEALSRVIQLLQIISDYRSLVICFDELDANKADSNGFTTPDVIADFIKTIHNSLSLEHCKNSVLLLSLWLPLTWEYKVVSREGLIDRVCSLPSLAKTPVELKKMNEEYSLRLVASWLQGFQVHDSSNCYHPFNESSIKEFSRNKPTPRMLWQWCAENWDKGDKIDPILERYKSLKSDEYPGLIDDESQIADALIYCCNQIIGENVENVKITGVIKPPNAHKMQLKITGTEDSKPISIGVGICQSAKAATVGAMLTRLLDYRKYNLTRGCLVRSKLSTKELSRNTQAYNNIEKLTSPPLNGEFVDLKQEEIIDLYVLQLLGKKSDLDSAKVLQFIKEKAKENGLIKEILSKPSGDISGIGKVVVASSSQPDTSGELSIEDFKES
jgi:Cdc6-like AAA superfamily ATPase